MSQLKRFRISKEVLWVSVGQRAAELRDVKVGGKKNLPIGPAAEVDLNQADQQNFFYSPTLTACSYAALRSLAAL